MNLAIRDIRYHRGRFILTSIGLGLLIGIVMSMGGSTAVWWPMPLR
ncbi:hypothetical protein [Geotalea toluenoxydans]|nr:hypothetical protein [Geotalea toluenoxydans]